MRGEYKNMDQVFYSKSGLSNLKPPRIMQIKIGQIYKVKPEFRDMCDAFNRNKKATYVRFLLEEFYTFLDKDKQVLLNNICNCYRAEHLEPLEKTLYNLEVNDFVEDVGGNKRKVIGSIENNSKNPLYFLSTHWDFESFDRIRSAKELEVNNYKVVQSEPTEEIKEMTVEEVSKLVGKKVKIVE